jgi:spermidine synthase
LIYQIVWQRALFAIFGVNIESVTVVVSAFMLGLGLGSLAGGYLSKHTGVRLLPVFGAVEIGIAIYGVISLPLFHWVATFSAGAPALQTGVLSFALVLVPTILMGATLPLLTAHLVRLSGNVGRAVGILYFVNTLGSAAACFAAALVTMRYLGMRGSVMVAVVLNVVVAVSVLLLHLRTRHNAVAKWADAARSDSAAALPLPTALALSALAGFISLSYEIVWYRLYSFATGGSPRAFAFVLGAFLAGIAFGSLFSRRMCTRAAGDLKGFAGVIATLVLAASLLGFGITPLVALTVRHTSYLWTLPLIAITAGLLGSVFPMLCHISVQPDGRAGAALSYLYLANIVGSAAGSWMVGFVLMDFLSLRDISMLLALLGMAAFAKLASSGRKPRAAFAFAAACVIAILGTYRPLFATVYAQLQYKDEYGGPGTNLTDIVETRSGVVTVDADAAIFGGGVYDGWVMTDVRDTRTVVRPLSISFFHPDPKEVLVIGMSGGAWSQVIANHPQVQREVIVEINPGYVEVIRRYPVVAPLLSNPKATIIIDDGRRWMFRNRRQKFDMIVMDTTYYWRAHATNLLSVEFLELARQMLKPGGILYYNSTFSRDAQRTGASHFPYAYRFGPFMAVSDSPIPIDAGRWRMMLENYRLEGVPILNLGQPADRAVLDEILHWPDTLPGETYESEGMETRENILRRTAGNRIITDDNMATEWGQ